MLLRLLGGKKGENRIGEGEKNDEERKTDKMDDQIGVTIMQ